MRNPKHVNSLHVKHIDMTIKEGDTVLLRPSKPRQPLWIAKIDKIDNGRFSAKWYFRPEETRLGRRIFNGANEVYSSDYCDTQSPETIERKCMVHNDKKYTELCYVGEDDFFCRFKYYADPPMLMPKRVPVFCKCEMPNNPDEFMVRCNKCSEWFHPSCIEMTRETAEQLPHFYCDGCDSQPQELPKGLQEDLIHVTRDDQDTVPVSHKDLKCLDPSEYLSSEIMNFYISGTEEQTWEPEAKMKLKFEKWFDKQTVE